MGSNKSNKKSSSHATSVRKKTRIPWTYMVVLSAFLAVIAFFTQQYLTRPGNTLVKLPPIRIAVDKTRWGTYRSQTYFGLRTRDPKSPLFGLMWYEQPAPQPYMPNVRHNCEQGDRMNSYAWHYADGRSFGQQLINDSSGLQLETSWIGDEDTFTAHLSGKQSSRQKRTTVILYIAKQDSDMSLSIDQERDPHATDLSSIIHGQNKLFGQFSLNVKITAKYSTLSTLSVGTSVDLTKLNDLVLMNTVASESPHGLVYVLKQSSEESTSNFVALQLNLPPDFAVEIAFSSQNHTSVSGSDFSALLQKRIEDYEEKFENAFELNGKGYSEKQLKLANIALSNMLGGIGYFYGYNKVRVPGHSDILPYGPHSLFTAVPSRPFFPRGFLWDEGFHNMLIRKFDQKLSLEIIVSWLNVMTEEGWIPREMILGEEAESRVPSEFVVQRSNVANPPSIFFVIGKMINDLKFVEENSELFSQMYPKLARWYKWLRSSQKGKEKGTFRWRGRNSTIDTELNPKTLASGLDDYPRASHPSKEEYHLDLRCWMAMCSRVMEQLANRFGSDSEKKKFSDFSRADSDFNDLVKLHWSESAKAFVDFGKHSSDVELKRVQKTVQKKKNKEMQPPPEWVWKRVVNEPPSLRLVDDVFGYNSLYPLIARLVPSNSEYMKSVLERMTDEKELWTDFGLRSISKKSPYYLQRNTEHDAPYWRGYIWMNINYMTLSALKFYSEIPGPLQARTVQVFEQLRHNLVNNVATQLDRSGYIWENYDDTTGEGRGCHPFTGWSSLILMIMSDQLDG